MADELVIRRATAEDIAGVLALYAQPDLDNGVVLELEEAKALFARFAAYPNYVLYVAERGGEVVGSFALLVMDNLGHLGAPSAVVEDVVVSPACQSQGVGAKMMRFALEQARQNNCYKIVLSSNLKRERAHAFYDSLGFTRHGYSFRMDLVEREAAE